MRKLVSVTALVALTVTSLSAFDANFGGTQIFSGSTDTTNTAFVLRLNLDKSAMKVSFFGTPQKEEEATDVVAKSDGSILLTGRHNGAFSKLGL